MKSVVCFAVLLLLAGEQAQLWQVYSRQYWQACRTRGLQTTFMVLVPVGHITMTPVCCPCRVCHGTDPAPHSISLPLPTPLPFTCHGCQEQHSCHRGAHRR